ncbi:MAG TPA: helix-turn-helix domain-containing protein, partial [Candidatus Binataceae bacterium]|nr:helix-turn-helix domain-containing protein [Candidatus Binataceae bacterium]
KPLISMHEMPADLGNDPGTVRVSTPQRNRSLEEVERELIFETLDAVGGNKARAAEILGISLKTLYNRLDRYRGRNRNGVA